MKLKWNNNNWRATSWTQIMDDLFVGYVCYKLYTRQDKSKYYHTKWVCSWFSLPANNIDEKMFIGKNKISKIITDRNETNFIRNIDNEWCFETLDEAKAAAQKHFS